VVKTEEENIMALLTANTKFGAVSGVPGGYTGYSVFKGIPYAAPPINELRWAAPVDSASWDGVRACDKFSATAIQNKQNPGDFYQKEFFPVQEPMSEDCLYLNVWTPAESDTEKLPVMVWIHGGAFIAGFGHEMEFDGEAFCKRGVILVTINYRLGCMGYFAHPELSKQNEKGVSGNYGLLDQIQALKWVKENIKAFGGDADNLTVFGQSAGGGSVISLCTSPLAEGLINKAIIQSAGGIKTLGGLFTLKDAEEFGSRVVEHSGLSWEEFSTLSADEVFTKVSAATAAMFEGKFILRLLPCMDGYVLPDDPGAAIESGKHHAIPYMAGWVSGDENFFGDHSNIDWLKLKNGDNPVYIYRFDHDVPGNDGAFHSSELWYIFATLQRCWRPMRGKDYDLSLRMTDYWTSFAKTANPNCGDWEVWPEYTTQKPQVFALKG